MSEGQHQYRNKSCICTWHASLRAMRYPVALNREFTLPALNITKYTGSCPLTIKYLHPKESCPLMPQWYVYYLCRNDSISHLGAQCKHKLMTYYVGACQVLVSGQVTRIMTQSPCWIVHCEGLVILLYLARSIWNNHDGWRFCSHNPEDPYHWWEWSWKIQVGGLLTNSLSLSLLSTTDCTAQSQVYEILLDQIAGLFQVIIIILGPTLLLHLMCVCVCVCVCLCLCWY